MYEIQQLREENRRIVDQLKIEEQKKLNEVKEKMLVEQLEIQSKNELDKKEYIQNIIQEQSQLEKQLKEH
jgi:hypothetical protein